MAQKPSPNSLIHCSQCGEDYSATYKRCPFCSAKNEPSQSDAGRPASSSDPEDTYVFDGQDLFDGAEDENDISAPSRGGKRLAGKASSGSFAAADINWPRLITFICSLIIIVAAMIIVFTVVYPQLRGNPGADNSQSPSSSVTEPGSDATPDPDSSAAVTDPVTTEPGAEPTGDVPPSAPAGLTAIAFSRGEKDADFTLTPGESHTITLVFTPASWSGDVIWTSSDPNVATVDASGKVTNVNTSGGLRRVIITASSGGLSLESTVYCRSAAAAATDPPASDAPSSDPPASDPPASPSPSGSGAVTVGSKGVIANTGAGKGTGVYVRREPSTNNKTSTGEDNKIASLFNGDPITVLEDAGNGWYKISYAGSGGKGSEGYVKGDYISTN